jgi:hypothetical protein
MADNAVKGSDKSVAHLGKAGIKFWLKWCHGFGVTIDLNLFLREDSRGLVLKFYTWGGTYQGENVLWSGTTPAQAIMAEDVPHPSPMRKPERVRLVLTDEDNNEVQTITTYMTRRGDLWGGIVQIINYWPFCPPENRECLWQMILEIVKNWPFAPS